MSILQQPNGFRRGNDAWPAGRANKFGDCRERDVFTAGNLVSLAHNLRGLDVDYLLVVDLRPKFVVRNDSAAVGISPGHERSAVHIGRARINRMMITKDDTVLGQLPKRRAVCFVHEIGAHSVPNNQHDVLRIGRYILGECDSAQDRHRQNRPASRPKGSQLYQSAGSPSSFENVISFEGAARLWRVRRKSLCKRTAN